MSKIILYNENAIGVTTEGSQYAFFINEDGLPAVKNGSEIIVFGTSGYAFAGSSGSSGENGSSGISGTSGESGTSGQDGAPGDMGNDGSSGSSGESGTNGISGDNGLDGTAGSSGISYGTSGSSGVSGLGAKSKGGTVTIAEFTPDGYDGRYQVVFETPFDNTDYSISFSSKPVDPTVTDIEPLVANKLSTGFDIMIASVNLPTPSLDTYAFDWLAVSQTETTNSTSGESGSSGSSGFDGSSGIDGSSGSSGDNGLDGPAGLDGSSGSSGISYGSSGSSGESGTSGVNGITAGRTYYYNYSQDSDVPGFKTLDLNPSGAIEQTFVTNLTSLQKDVLIQGFMTPQLGFAVIPGGAQRFHMHFLKENENHDVIAYVKIQLCDASGTPLAGPAITSNSAAIGWAGDVSPAEVIVDLILPTTGIDPTNRMLVNVYLSNDDSGKRDITFYTEGTSNYSFVGTTVGAFSSTSGSSGSSGVSGVAGTSGTSAGGGAAGIDLYNSIKTPMNLSGLPFYKLNIPSLSYSGANYTLNDGIAKFMPVYSLSPGEIIKDVAIYVTGGIAGSVVKLGLYSLALDGNGNIYCDRLVSTFGTVDTSTNGRKVITDINFTIPTSLSNMYYVGLLQVGGAGNVTIIGPTNTTSLTYFSSLDGGIMNRQMSITGGSGLIELLPTISPETWITYNNVTTFGYVGFKS